MTPYDRDLRSAHGWSRCGGETKGFSGAAARTCGYVEIYRGIYVNPHVPRSDLHKVHYPINLQVNPDRTTAIAMEKKTGSRKAAKGFFLVQGIAVVLVNWRNCWYRFILIISTNLYQLSLNLVSLFHLPQEIC
jgi:hypothetical protein